MTGRSWMPDLVATLLRAAETEAGGATVAAHDEDYELLRRGDDTTTVLRMRGGVAQVVDHATPGFCSYTKATFDDDVLEDLAAGALTPTEAVVAGRILLQSRLYGGGQLLRLMRIAQVGGMLRGNSPD